MARGATNSLVNDLRSELNKAAKENVAYDLHGDNPTDVKPWIPTGSTLLDYLISNKRNGGIPVGKLTTIAGESASGKSLVVTQILANCQKMGGLAVYIDTENSVSEEFLKVLGIDTTQLLYLQLQTVEQIFQAIEEIVLKVREAEKDRLVTILVDSLAAASTQVEIDADFEKDGWATSKAIIISKALRKITQLIGRQRIALVFTNQLRTKLGVMFGDPWTTSGGKALPFHASTRIRLKNKGRITDSKKNVLGMTILAQVIKNRLGPPLRHAEFPLYFESGIDDIGSWLEVMKKHKLVKSAGAWYTYTDVAGEEYKFQSKDFLKVLKENSLKDEVYDRICDKVILKYDIKDMDESELVKEEVEGDE